MSRSHSFWVMCVLLHQLSGPRHRTYILHVDHKHNKPMGVVHCTLVELQKCLRGAVWRPICRRGFTRGCRGWPTLSSYLSVYGFDSVSSSSDPQRTSSLKTGRTSDPKKQPVLERLFPLWCRHWTACQCQNHQEQKHRSIRGLRICRVCHTRGGRASPTHF